MCWGANQDGQLGIGNNVTSTSIPTYVQLDEGVNHAKVPSICPFKSLLLVSVDCFEPNHIYIYIYIYFKSSNLI